MDILDDSLFSLFKIGVSIQHLNKKTEKNFGLSLVQWCLLKCLINMPAAPAHVLAKVAGVHPSTLTQSLKRLERKGYIFITEDPNDSRRKLISLTRIGKNILDKNSIKMEQWSKKLLPMEKELTSVRSFLREQLNFES